MRHSVTIIKETKKKLYLISNEPIAKECTFAKAVKAVKAFKQTLISEGYPVLDVFIPNEFEIFGSWIYGENSKTTYKPFKFFRTRENRQKYLSECWLCSYYYFGCSDAKCFVASDGYTDYMSANNLANVNPIIILDKTKH